MSRISASPSTTNWSARIWTSSKGSSRNGVPRRSSRRRSRPRPRPSSWRVRPGPVPRSRGSEDRQELVRDDEPQVQGEKEACDGAEPGRDRQGRNLYAKAFLPSARAASSSSPDRSKDPSPGVFLNLLEHEHEQDRHRPVLTRNSGKMVSGSPPPEARARRSTSPEASSQIGRSRRSPVPAVRSRRSGRTTGSLSQRRSWQSPGGRCGGAPRATPRGARRPW